MWHCCDRGNEGVLHGPSSLPRRRDDPLLESGRCLRRLTRAQTADEHFAAFDLHLWGRGSANGAGCQGSEGIPAPYGQVSLMRRGCTLPYAGT